MVGQYESRYISTDVLLHSLSEEAAAAMITLLDDAGINRFYLDPDITRAQLTAFLLKGDNTRIFTRKKNLALDFKSYSFIEMAVRHISQTYTHLENNPEGWTGMFWAGHDRGEFLMELVQGVVDGLTAPNADVRRVSAELLSVCKINCGTGQEKVQLLSILNEGRGRVIVELPNDQTKALSVNALNRQIAQLGVPVTDNMNATGGRTFGADMGPGSNESATDEADRELLSHLTVSETEDQIGVLAAEAILKDIKDSVSANGRAVILFASAPSQHSTWKHLLALWSELPETERQYLADRIVAFHMDEYLGLDENAPQLFGKVLRENLFSKLGLKDENIFYFDDRAGYATALELRKAVSDADNEKVAVLTARLESEVKENLEKLEAKFKDLGGVFDIVIGGIGKLPHLAFNDPPEAKFNDDKILKIVTLTETSRQQQVDDKEFASLQDVPTHALTFSLTSLTLLH
jgi:glucosamine-6-phosphate deaminase